VSLAREYTARQPKGFQNPLAAEENSETQSALRTEACPRASPARWQISPIYRSMWSYVVFEPKVADCNRVYSTAPRYEWTPSARLYIGVLLSRFHREVSERSTCRIYNFEGT
jgi:hypothetical protein